MSTTAVYRYPGPFDIHGGKYDFRAVPDGEVDTYLADGWHLTTPEAKAAHEDKTAAPVVPVVPDDDAPVTRSELEQKAAELGVKVDGRWSDKRLEAEITSKLGG